MKFIKNTALCFICAAMVLTSGCAKNNTEKTEDTTNMIETESKKEYVPAYFSDGSAEDAEKWLRERIGNNGLYSFKYDGKNYGDFISSWDKDVKEATDEDGNKTFTVTYVSPEKVTFTVDVTLDVKYAKIEWSCNFVNGSGKSSPVISDILPLDYTVDVKDAVLTTTKGSNAAQDDFEPITADLSKGSYGTCSDGGRSSSCAFPYFDISGTNGGVIAAVGWTGDWKANFKKSGDSVTVSAGMKETKIALFPGEKMRTPASLIMFYKGDQDAGHNKFRQLILDSYTPVGRDGKPLTTLPYCINVWGGSGEEEIMNAIDLCERVGLDYDALWIDAGWYCSTATSGSSDLVWYNELGNWDVSPAIYPAGFKNISAKLSSLGKDLLLWFEPERAMPGTQIANEHPEYFLPKATSFLVYNFASDEATDYMIDKVSSILSENGISWYRQDFNCAPADTWKNSDRLDGENRVGMTEIKYITNLYRYLDALCERNPGLVIDNCASGGRRLDFEMMRRSVPLWRTDYNVTKNSITDGVRMSTYGLSWWLPMSEGGCSSEGRATDYHWRSMTAAGLVLGAASVRGNLYLKGIEDYELCKKYITGDYYILCQGLQDKLKKEYAVYEYFRPDEDDGCLIVFRPEDCVISKKVVKLKGLDPNALYSLFITETGETVEATGNELMNTGLTLKLAKANTSLLILINNK